MSVGPELNQTNLPLSSLRRYLRATGWRSRVLPRPNLELFVLSGADANDIELVIPTTASEPDTQRRILLALETLSDLEERDISAVAGAVRLIGFDIMKARLPDHLVFRDTIYLRLAENFLRHTRKLLQNAASTELLPDRFLSTIPKEGEEYASRCRLGHTFRGSFGFTVESPVGPNTDDPGFELNTFPTPPPFERRVIERVVRGLHSVALAEVESNPEIITRGFDKGFSADMCDDLVRLVESTEADTVTFDFAFSPEWSISMDVLRASHVTISSRAVAVTKEASQELRQRKVDPYQHIRGRIIRLESKDNPSDLLRAVTPREVAVLWESAEFGDINVRIRLAPEDYLAAVRAHESGQEVIVTGRLEKVGRGWVLSDPTDFRAA